MIREREIIQWISALLECRVKEYVLKFFRIPKNLNSWKGYWSGKIYYCILRPVVFTCNNNSCCVHSFLCLWFISCWQKSTFSASVRQILDPNLTIKAIAATLMTTTDVIVLKKSMRSSGERDRIWMLCDLSKHEVNFG